MSIGRRRNGTNTMQCFSNAECRIGKQRLEELQSGCRAGVYSHRRELKTKALVKLLYETLRFD